MCEVFEIVEKDKMDWVGVMMSESKEHLFSNVVAYKINEWPIREYIIYNENVDKCVLFRTDSDYNLKYMILNYDMQRFLVSPDNFKGLRVYNLTKMTPKCKKFRLRFLGSKIEDFIWNIVDEVTYSSDNIGIILILAISAVMLLVVYFSLFGG